MFGKKNNCFVPADVPSKFENEFCKNYTMITQNTDHLFLFACDQKIEHLNADFYGERIHPDAAHAEHIFKIASQSPVGALATHLGLIARYGKQYPTIPYIAKLNGKTDLIKPEHKDPFSLQLWRVHDAIKMKEEHNINICGIGLTLYIGSEYEAEMLQQTAQIIRDAHDVGLIAIIWIYPRGKAISNDQDPELLAGAVGIAASLGADFVKIKAPLDGQGKSSMQWLEIASAAAGNTKIICSGGKQIEAEQLLKNIHEQITIGKVDGCAVGRNIFQRALPNAIALSKAIAAIVYQGKGVENAIQIYKGLIS